MPWPYSSDLRLTGATDREFVLTRPRSGLAKFFLFGVAFLFVGLRLLPDASDRLYACIFLVVGVVCTFIAIRRSLWRESLTIDFDSRACTLTKGWRFSPAAESGSLDALRIQGIEFTPGVEITANGRKPGGTCTLTFVFDDHEPVTLFESPDATAAQAKLKLISDKLRLPATVYEWNEDLSALNRRAS